MVSRQRGNTTHTGALFSVGTGDNLVMTPGSTFTNKDLIQIDRAIRHLPCVVKVLEAKAKEVLAQVGSDNFEIVLSTKGIDRPRVFVVPKTSAGIHQCLADSVLLKASLSMKGH
jgi:hypothetical protein